MSRDEQMAGSRPCRSVLRPRRRGVRHGSLLRGPWDLQRDPARATARSGGEGRLLHPRAAPRDDPGRAACPAFGCNLFSLQPCPYPIVLSNSPHLSRSSRFLRWWLPARPSRPPAPRSQSQRALCRPRLRPPPAHRSASRRSRRCSPPSPTTGDRHRRRQRNLPGQPGGLQASNSLWIGSRFAGRTRPVTVRAETRGGVTFDGGGATYFGGLSFNGGAHHQTWDGFSFANGKPTQTGVIVFGGSGGGYAGLAPAPHHPAPHHDRWLAHRSTTPAHDHSIYFSGGRRPHDILHRGLSRSTARAA